jgi:hypothetical protein
MSWEIEERLNRVRSPFRVADVFGVEEIIDPRDTRPLLCEFANLAARLREAGPVSTAMRLLTEPARNSQIRALIDQPFSPFGTTLRDGLRTNVRCGTSPLPRVRRS